MRLSDFDFSLPEALIAQRPVYPRTAARLLQVRGDGSRVDRTFADLAACLHDGDLLVFNNSQVFASRLIGQRERDGQRFDGRIELTLVAETDEPALWVCYARPGKKLEPGDGLFFGDRLRAVVEAKDGDVFTPKILSAIGEITEKSRDNFDLSSFFSRFFRPRFCENIRGGLADLFGPV